MPFIKVDQEMYDEIVSELGDEVDLESLGPRPSGDFQYEGAQSTFKPDAFSPVSRETLAALRAMNATSFKVKYDGGHDEGFSHADTVYFGQSAVPAAALAVKLGTPEFVKRLREAAASDARRGNAGQFYANSPDDKVVMNALEELAFELASKLLGNGFGTGEYELYGQFTADLTTGQIVDSEDAPKPTGRMP